MLDAIHCIVGSCGSQTFIPCELLSEGHGLLPGRLPGMREIWAARTALRTAVGKVTKGERIFSVGPIFLSAAVIATLLIIGGVELNPGPDEISVQVFV